MNLLLFTQDDIQNPEVLLNHSFDNPLHVKITNPRQIEHLQKILRAKVGDKIRVGLLNHLIGDATIKSISDHELYLHAHLTQTPPKPLQLQLVLGLPRPKMLKRCLQSIASLGIKKIVLINAFCVEKSYWQTPWLEPQAIEEQLRLGLEQACDTQMPDVRLVKRFKPFVEDEIKSWVGDSRALVAHPYTETPCPNQLSDALSLAIGPEGGFIAYEVELLKQQGFEAVHLGERILKVETALPYIVGRLSV